MRLTLCPDTLCNQVITGGQEKANALRARISAGREEHRYPSVDSAELIAAGVITVAKTGQLASTKYLFEAVGLYPATEQTSLTPVVGSLAHALLRRDL
jgi:hypothetical protein